MEPTKLPEQLKKIGQESVLRFHDKLDAAAKSKLEAQLVALDAAMIRELADEYVRNKPKIVIPKDIQPVKAYPYKADDKHRKLYADAAQRGAELLKAGKVGAFLVAGGQGTRLGYDGPKGEYPVTPIKNKPLFQVFAEQLQSHAAYYGHPIPWYIMTSDINDAATRAFFKKHNHFGCNPADVFFFPQGMMPAFSMDGKLLLAEKDSLALSPDGHGGSLRALDRSGALADMKRRGVEHLSYFQVDNPIVHCMDPLFLGLHDLTGSEMSSKSVSKAGPLEKVGNFVVADGAVQVIEYSDLPDELAKQTNPDKSLRFNAGSIAIHALRVSFIDRLNSGGSLKLPWHRAEKKVPYINEAGESIKPDKPNAVKLEQFVFDAIPLAKNAIVYETDRAEEFSPVKNAEGTDSPATCRRDQIRRSAKWLRDAGVKVTLIGGEPEAILEISPLYAPNADRLKEQKVSAVLPTVPMGMKVYLGSNGLDGD